LAGEKGAGVGFGTEIRAYYQQRSLTTELQDFPYEQRGYSIIGRESSAVHPRTTPPSTEPH
jgi:hypothetical protein